MSIHKPNDEFRLTFGIKILSKHRFKGYLFHPIRAYFKFNLEIKLILNFLIFTTIIK